MLQGKRGWGGQLGGHRLRTRRSGRVKSKQFYPRVCTGMSTDLNRSLLPLSPLPPTLLPPSSPTGVPFHFRGRSGSVGSVTTSRWLPSGGGTRAAPPPRSAARPGLTALLSGPRPPWPPTRSHSHLLPRRRLPRRSRSRRRRRLAQGLAQARAGPGERAPAPGTRSSWP